MANRGDASTGRERSGMDIMDMASAATWGAEVWLDSQADLLHEVDSITQGWLERRRETIDAMWQSMEEMRNSNPTEILRIQQEWITTSLRRVVSDLEAWIALAATTWRRTMLRFEEGENTRKQVEPADESIVDSGEVPMLSTAGSKPRGRPRGRPRVEIKATTARAVSSRTSPSLGGATKRHSGGRGD